MHSCAFVRFRPHSNRSLGPQGFTLVEMMAVVTIIAVMIGLAGPAMMNSFGDARAEDLAGRIVNMFNGARARANGSGRAQLLRFTLADNDGQGGLVAYEGNTSSCNVSNWAAIIAAGCGPTGFCTEVLDPRQRQMVGDTLQLGLLTTGDRGTWEETLADLCYEPTGLTFWRAGAVASSDGLMSSENGGGAGGSLRGGFRFHVQRLDSTTAAISVDRELVAPLGAAARVSQ